jgi:hypothetical protein
MLHYETGYGHRAIRSESEEVEKWMKVFICEVYILGFQSICRALGKRLAVCVLFNVINNQHTILPQKSLYLSIFIGL